MGRRYPHIASGGGAATQGGVCARARPEGGACGSLHYSLMLSHIFNSIVRYPNGLLRSTIYYHIIAFRTEKLIATIGSFMQLQ